MPIFRSTYRCAADPIFTILSDPVGSNRKARMKTLSKDQFTSYLRSALHNLYYPDQLRRNPLSKILGIDQDFNASSLIQRILIDEIEKLKPLKEEPPQSRSWRIYEVLVYRYIRQYDRELVANQLGISGRQFRREQRTALEALADALTRRYSLETKVNAMQDVKVEEDAEVSYAVKEPIPDELSWLKDIPHHAPTDFQKVMNEVLNLSRPLAERFNVYVNYAQKEDTIPDLDIPAIPLRHVFLTLLNDAIPQSSGKSLNIFVAAGEKEMVVEIVGQKLMERKNDLLENSRQNLSIVQHIMEMFSGSFSFTNEAGYFTVKLSFPTFEKVSVLIIDDNPDAILLFQRYTSNTRYSVTGVRDPSKAVHQAEILSPKIIILDLMMPGVDGWEILNQIRENSLTNAIPVVVVSILPQESLALTLGANAFLQKPINQNDFLNLLNQHFPKNHLT